MTKGSPWLDEITRSRPEVVLEEDDETDVAVVGGGISGIVTAYYLLTRTDRRVMLLEKDLVGHGATGHNGGQAVVAFESFHEDLAQSLGKERTDQGYRELHTARRDLQDLLKAAGLTCLMFETKAHVGVVGLEAIWALARERKARQELGLEGGRMMVADDVAADGIDAERVPRWQVNALLWSKDPRYSGALEMTAGMINSYALVEELASFLLNEYPLRFALFERSPVARIRLGDEDVVLGCNGRIVLAGAVVMCTNGYQLPDIEACSDPALGQLRGVVGYMIGKEDPEGVPGTRLYYPDGKGYNYLTRRPFKDGWLTAMGGPEGPIDTEYRPDLVLHPGAFEELEAFMAGTIEYYQGPPDRRWQGLMGYTSSGARVAGRDPQLPTLYYNLGCNGNGLMSAVAGAVRVVRRMNGEDLPPSVFDPEVIVENERIVQRAR